MRREGLYFTSENFKYLFISDNPLKTKGYKQTFRLQTFDGICYYFFKRVKRGFTKKKTSRIRQHA